jgi:hypothetical protein
MSNAIFVGWNRAIAGRESHSLEHFGEGGGWLGKQKADGNIADFDIVTLQVHGGDLNGFAVVKGDAAQLTKLQDSEEWQDHIARGARNMQGLGVIPAFVGDELAKQLGRFQKYL